MSDTCPACLSSRTRPAFRGDRIGFRRCTACGSLRDPVPYSPAQRAELYGGRDYFVKDPGAPPSANGYPGDYLADRRHIEQKFDRVLGHLERYVEPGRLLDVGAGPGFLLAVAERRGWEAVGIDVNPWAAAHAAAETGVDVRCVELEDAGFAPGSFDAVTLMDVVEHVSDPAAMLEHVAELVRPGGAVAVLTPDAAAPVSRMLGRRWPEVTMPGEHPVVFSRRGLAAALARHGFAPSGWHPVGKTTDVETLLADAAAAAPAVADRARRLVAGRALGRRVVGFDPRTKFCLYARRAPRGVEPGPQRPPRVPKRPETMAGVDEAILDELEALARARRYGDWLFDTFAAYVPGARVLEVGAGIGTFSQRMLDIGATHVLAVEPDDRCADVLDERLGSDPRVTVSRDRLPGAATLEDADGSFDLVVCQNVLEHIADDRAAVADMARVLRPGGRLVLVVPAGPGLFGPLDDAYGHWRRYDAEGTRGVVDAAGLEVTELRPMNLPGIAAWWVSNRRPGARVSSASMRAYEAVVAAVRPIEERRTPPVGLSLVCVARRPEDVVA